MANCEICEEKYGRIREGHTVNGWDTVMCRSCESNAEEAAWEDWCERFYGSGSPVGIKEQWAAAVKERAELRRRD